MKPVASGMNYSQTGLRELLLLVDAQHSIRAANPGNFAVYLWTTRQLGLMQDELDSRARQVTLDKLAA